MPKPSVTSFKLGRRILRGLLGRRIAGSIEFRLGKRRADPWGGPFNNQRGRQRIFLELVSKLDPTVIIETGTYLGTTTEYMANTALVPVHSVEMDPWCFGYAQARFRKNPGVTLYFGDSREILRNQILKSLSPESRAIIYLDAHWHRELPLQGEIAAILEELKHSIVMIDDFEVPEDPGYGFDSYPDGVSLSLASLAKLGHESTLYFYPKIPSSQETGQRRGCIVFGTDAAMVALLRSTNLLREAA